VNTSKNRYIVEVVAKAYVTSKVIVEASSQEEAEAMADKLAFEPYGLTDIDNSPIEGVGDLVWAYRELDVEETNPIIEVGPARKI
jgi:hypothetical protein